MKNTDTNKKTTIIRICLILLLGALLFLLLILPLRALMNAVNRIDFISQRLDDYPRMYATYLQETEEWWTWWQTEDYEKRARQAAFLYAADASHGGEEDKLDYIARTLGAEKARVISPAEYQALSEKAAVAGTGICSTELAGGKLLVLTFSESLMTDRMSFVQDKNYFMSQLQAGLPGYVCVLHKGELSVYPADENGEALRSMIGGMLESGELAPGSLLEKAKKNGQKTALGISRNARTASVPAGKYLLFSAAYTDNDDLVINVSETSDMIRFARKRSWSLWFLCCAIIVLLAYTLWNTALYRPRPDPAEEYHAALKKSVSALFLAVLLMLGSVLVIQMLSGVNLAQAGATDQAEYLKNVLDKESERASSIAEEFDAMYTARAQRIAEVLSENPQLIDTDSLYSLDQNFSGSGLRVFNAEGELLASDEILHHVVDESIIENAAVPSDPADRSGGGSSSDTAASDAGSAKRYYRAVMVDESGKTTGWVEFCAGRKQLDELLQDTRLQEVVGDLHILDTLHVVVTEGGAGGRIVASTWKNWVGDVAEEHGIHTEYLYDGYEGIVNFEGNKCYSVVFAYKGNYVIVGSENETALVFFGGVLLLTVLLVLVMMPAVYRPLVKRIFAFQKEEYETYQARISAADPAEPGSSDPYADAFVSRSEYPRLKAYLRDFMIAVFLLSSVLYFTTNGSPTGLTYNIVRGTWVRGINAATVTTCIMLASVVCALQRLVDLFLSRLGKYLSPKGMTICRLLDSCLTYMGTIVLILYALSMFGVNTAALLGGVGATALIFTLGANSLIADVVAGLFIIFEGDYTVGDVVVIDDFRGIVTDIGIRTTKLMDDNTRDIKIINNSAIRELTNQSREKSAVIIDIPISNAVGLEKGEEILQEAIKALPAHFPKILGKVSYWGVSTLPEKNAITGKMGGCKGRIAFSCLENDREMLTYQVYRELVGLVNELNMDPPPSA